MPYDPITGVRADVIVSPETVFNRMNTSQWYEQFLNLGGKLIAQRVTEWLKQDRSPASIEKAFAYVLEYLGDINEKWAGLLSDLHQDIQAKAELLDEIIKMQGLYIQVSPFQKGLDTKLALKLMKKYNIEKHPVTFTIPDASGKERTYTTKKPVLIAPEYWYLLYKMPHMRCASTAYINQYHSPVRANALAKLQYPFSQTPIRLGEDEIRNLQMVAGPEVAAHILGVYANSNTAVTQLSEHLLFDKNPSQLNEIEMDTGDIIATNSIIAVTKHIFSAVGVDITPKIPKMSDEDYLVLTAVPEQPKKRRSKGGDD